MLRPVGVDVRHRFLKRLWTLAVNQAEIIKAGPGDLATLDDRLKEARREIHEALKQARIDYERQQFNTVISACMTIVNTLYKLGNTPGDHAVIYEGLGSVLRLLGPIAPHATHRLWRDLGYGNEILEAGWPVVDESALQQESIQLVVQVNGKVRARIQVPAEADKATVEQTALADENVKRFVGEAQVRKVIVVPGKLVNVVAK